MINTERKYESEKARQKQEFDTALNDLKERSSAEVKKALAEANAESLNTIDTQLNLLFDQVNTNQVSFERDIIRQTEQGIASMKL